MAYLYKCINRLMNNTIFQPKNEMSLSLYLYMSVCDYDVRYNWQT